MSDKRPLTDVKTLRAQARKNIEEGAVTAGYSADRNEVLRLLDFGAVMALIGAFFLLANQLSLAQAAAWIGGLVVFLGTLLAMVPSRVEREMADIRRQREEIVEEDHVI